MTQVASQIDLQTQVSLHPIRSRPTILVVGGFPPSDAKIYGGIVTSCRMLLNSTFSERFKLILIDSTQISNPPPYLLKRLLLSMLRFARFALQLWRKRPDAVLLFTSKGASLVEKGAMAWFARVLGIPSLIFPRGGGLIQDVKNSRFQRIWCRYALQGAERFLCQGPAWKRFAIEEIGFASEKVEIVPNWTASKELLRIGFEREYCSTKENLDLLFMGWLEKEKGIFELLESCLQLSSRRAFTLTIAGKGRAELAVRKFVEKNGLADRVVFAGWAEGAEKDALFRKADVFVLPSWSEGLPNAMIESMAAGVAVIVTEVGNIPDVISDGIEAILVSPKDVPALTKALDRMFDLPELRITLAKKGHVFASETFSVECAVSKLSDVIESVIENHR